MSQLTDLPKSLEELAFYQAAELRDSTFKEDCNRLANELGLRAEIEPKPAAGKSPRSKWNVSLIAGLAAVLLLLLALGFVPWRKHHARQIQVQQILNTAQTQTELGEYESAFKSCGDAVKADPANQSLMDWQADAAMLWLRNFHVLIGEGQNATSLAGPPLAAIISVLEAAFSRTNGHGSRAADILAHLGWAHWLNWHIAEKDFGPAAEQDMRRSVAVDPSNVYGNAMLGNWLLQTNGDVREAVQRFDVAVRSNKERAWVRTMQLGAMEYNERTLQELVRVVNQMRINAEPINSSDRRRVLSDYSFAHSMDDLRKTLSAIPADDAWATFQWLDKQDQTQDPERQKIHSEFIHANILDLGGRRSEALAIFLELQREMKSKDYSVLITREVDAAVKRLSARSPSANAS
jgi:hypothetical protein